MTLALSSSIDFRSLNDPSTILPRNFIGIFCIDGIVTGPIVKGEEFIQRPLMMTIDLDLSGRNSIPAHSKAVEQRSKRVEAAGTEQAKRFRSSIKALIKGNLVELTAYSFTGSERAYSMTTFIPTRNKIIESVHAV